MTDQERRRTDKLKRGMKINFKLKDGGWFEGIVTRRTGKATGKYRDYWEVQDSSTDEVKEYNIENDWCKGAQTARYKSTRYKHTRDATPLTSEMDWRAVRRSRLI